MIWPDFMGSGQYVHDTETAVAGGFGTPYLAFGGITRASDDDLLILVRSAPDHDVDGKLVRFDSTDDGATWSGPTDVLDTSADLRDCEVTTLASGTLIASYTTRTNGMTDFVPKSFRSTNGGSTWDTPVTITHGFSGYGFISGKIIELANGDLLAPIYGIDSGSGYCRVSKSTNGGTSWSAFATIVADGHGSRSWEEPTITIDPSTGDLYCAIRSDTSTPGIYLSKSTDDGATWSTPVRLFDGSGRPSIYWTADDALAIMYRHTGSGSGVPAARWSFDSGVSWTAHRQFNSGGNFAYGSWITTHDGGLGAMWSVEQSSSRCDITYDTFSFVP